VFINELRESKSKSANKPDQKIQWLISWGFFGKKGKSEEQIIQKQMDFESKLHLPYNERVEEDLPKIRINVSMKAGYYIRTDRALEVEIPKYIIDMSYEVLKITMLEEQMFIKDPEVLESIKEFKYLLEGIYELDENLDPVFDERGLPIRAKLILELDEEGNPKIDEEGNPIISVNSKIKKEEPLELDGILDKINQTGYSSLSSRELKFLEEMSRG
jgi:hypothetical protein